MDTTEKFNKFSHMVMKEAEEKKNEIIAHAEKTHQQTIETSELDFLKRAYEHIQNAIRKIDKSINEEVSKAVVESKQALFTRRDEIIESVFQNVRGRIKTFKEQSDYPGYLEQQLRTGLSQVGEGELLVLVDGEDLNLMREVLAKTGRAGGVEESDDPLLGGCIVINKTRSIMSDCSLMSRLEGERTAFLENYGLSIE